MRVAPISFNYYNNISNSRKTVNMTPIRPMQADFVTFSSSTPKEQARKRVIIMLGAPNSGKGTCAQALAKKYDIPQISMGDLFRNEVKKDSEVGRLAKSYMDKGSIVPDEIAFELLKKRIAEPDCQKGYILDGFPRTLNQAKQVSEVLSEDKNVSLKVIHLDVDKDILRARVAKRYICQDCGKTQSVENYNPKTSRCECGGELFKRKDDDLAVFENRLVTHDSVIQPLLDYYAKDVNNVKVNSADTSIDDVFMQIDNIIGKE